jgi:hypothetical protein
MRRLIIGVIVLFMHAAPGAHALQTPAPPDDGIARLLRSLERALVSGRVEDLRAIATPAVTPATVSQFALAVGNAAGAAADRTVVIRERLRRPTPGAGYDVVADILISRGIEGRVATWLIGAAPRQAADGAFAIADLRELSAIDGLLKLRLDASRQFAVKNLSIGAPDLELTLASGVGFAVLAPGGITGMVLRGKGVLRFSPPDPAEQLQLRIFSHRSDFTTDVDTVFVRMNPREFEQRVAMANFTPVAVDAADLERAQQVFDDYAPRTYSLDLKPLTPDRWSLEPVLGSVVFEFRTSRHGWLTYTRSPAEPEDIALFDRAGSRNICLYRSAAKGASRGRAYGDENVAGYDVEHYGLDLAFDPARLRLAGRGSLSLLITGEAATTVTIKLAQQLLVSKVSSPQFGELLALRVIGQNNLLIGLPSQVRGGSRLTLDFSYAGTLAPQPIDQESIAPQGQSQAPPQEDRLIVTPEPRFMYSNRVQWYPQGLTSDYATADLQITVPAEYQVVASGRMVGSSGPPAQAGPAPAGATRTVQYLADRPVRYLACLISRMQVVGRTVADVPVVAPAADSPLGPPTSVVLDVLATSRVAPRNRQTAARAGAMVKFFAEQLAEAPYPTLTVAALDDNLPGGHSPAYLVALHQALPSTPYSWSDDPVAFEVQYPNFFLAHEIAHQWWGQAVGWRNYHDQWLSEGLTQYFAVLFAAEDRGPDLLASLIATMRETSQPALGQGPISLGYRIGHIRRDARALRSILYNKSAVVLHMLRRYIGDEAFFAGLRKFYAEWRFRKAGTDDLQAAFQAVTPRNLDVFFEKWIRGFTLPRVKITWRTEDDGRTGVIRAEQKADPFDFPLTVVLQTADGQSQERTLAVTGAVYEERVPLSSALRKVIVRDPLTYFELAR